MELVSNVVPLECVTSLDISAERVLTAALDSSLQSCMIIGWDAEGELYFASSKSDGGEVLWWMEKAKQKLLEVG